MKKIIFLFLVLTYTSQAQYRYLSPFNSEGVPSVLDYEPLSERMKANVKASLPESYPVPKYHPQYISNGSDTDVKITKDADVWVTFVDEGAGYRNTLGFYTYTGAPHKPSADEITIIFPNVSKIGSGGGLGEGFKIRLGRFSAGTNIGWVLIADGFKNGKVTNGNWILYSTPSFNPEGDPNLQFHNVLLKDEIEQKVVMGFEDIRRDNGGCDNDFNDAIFIVSANPADVLMNTNINTVTESGDAGTGGDGGLESNGALAIQVAQRHFVRQITPQPNYDTPDLTQKFANSEKGHSLRTGGVGLSQWIPEKPFADETEAYTSTPTDLVRITNAKEVLAVDYFSEKRRMAAILSLYTEGQVYNHTKNICDRLNGGSIGFVRPMTIKGNDFILTQITQPNQTIEYVVCFSVTEVNSEFLIERHWAINDFPMNRNYYNFQVWAKAPHLAQVLVEKILMQLETNHPLLFLNQKVSLPTVFVRQGHYKNGNLYLDIVNQAKAKNITFNGTAARTETQTSREPWSWETTLTEEIVQHIEIPVNQFFDSGIELKTDASQTSDVLYLADSPWGVDTQTDYITQFEVSNNSIGDNTKGNYFLERNAFLKGSVKNNVSLFKLLKSSAQSSDMKAFEGIQFEAKGTGIVEVILMKKSIANPEEQFRIELRLTEKLKTFQILYKDLYSVKLKNFQADDLTAVVFSFNGTNIADKLFEIQVNNLQFVKSFQTEIASRKPAQNVMSLYPNPCTESATLAYEVTQENLENEIIVINPQGKVMTRLQTPKQMGRNNILIDTQGWNSGIYFVQLRNETQTSTQKLIVIK